jgi:hypothetical protein
MDAQQAAHLDANAHLWVNMEACQRFGSDGGKRHPLRFKDAKNAAAAIADKDTLALIRAIASTKPAAGVPCITSEINQAVAISGTGQLVLAQ